MTKKQAFVALCVVGSVGAAGCASDVGNMALGAGAAGAAYEYSNKRQLDDLEKERQEGKISQEEHDRRAQEIKERSVLN